MNKPDIVGKRVELIHTNDPWTHSKRDDKGTVTFIDSTPFPAPYQIADIDRNIKNKNKKRSYYFILSVLLLPLLSLLQVPLQSFG